MERLGIFFLTFMLSFLSVSTYGRDKTTQKLRVSQALKIPYEQCQAIEDKLGQLLYINVDGYGDPDSKKSPIHEKYLELAADLQVGGILPHPDRYEPMRLQRTYRKLQSNSRLPLLVGIDLHDSVYTNGRRAINDRFHSSVIFGLGAGSGVLNDHGADPKQCLADRAFLNGFFHRTLGINHALGPTVDAAPGSEFLRSNPENVAAQARVVIGEFHDLGITTTLKHFPYVPETYSLHKRSEDTLLPAETVRSKLQVFKALAGQTDFAMSTHLLNSNVDPNSMATFSKTWISILRNEVGFKGLLMTDGLFMIKGYPESIAHMERTWAGLSSVSINHESMAAVMAILAGHDMALVEGRSGDTYVIFENLMRVACDSSPMSIEFRERIQESYNRITEWKESNKSKLLKSLDVSATVYDQAVSLFSSRDLCSRHQEVEQLREAINWE